MKIETTSVIAHTRTVVTVWLAEADQFRYTGETYPRGKDRTAQINHVTASLSDDQTLAEEGVHLRGQNVNVDGSLGSVHREFETPLTALAPHIRDLITEALVTSRSKHAAQEV